MVTRYRVGLLMGLAALLVFPLANSFASPTGYEIEPEFHAYYEQSGGIPVFGYAVSEPIEENGHLVQYFERQRLELHPEYVGTPYEVLLGHLGLEDAQRRGLTDTEAFQPRSSGNGDGDFFEETGHNLGGIFRDYWHDYGLDFGDPGVSFRESLALFGYPISEEFVDSETGLTTQYFERARFEHHPEHAGTEYEVLLGHLGNSEMEFQRANGRLPFGDTPPGQQDRDNNDDQQQTESDTNDGIDESTPSTSIQQIVDDASSGATVTVPAGVYRETVTINKPITLVAESGAEIRGSDVWTGWSQSGSTWVSSDQVPQFGNGHGHCWDGDLCKRQEQVFVDGQELTQVGSNPGSGEFAVNGSRQIVLGQDPSGRAVEVSTREYWVVPASSNVTVEGFTMKHAANRAQTGAISSNGYDNWTIRNNNLSHAHGANVSLHRGNNLELTGNDISYGGQLGVHGSEASGIQVMNNRIYENNQAAYSNGWEAGGLKFAGVSNVTLDGNEAHNNQGAGLWCDLDCDDVTFSNNRAHDNLTAGIQYEISRNARIFDNVVWNNGFGHHWWGWGAGILIQNSRDTEVFDNIVAWNADGISIISQNRENSWSPDGNSRPDWNRVVNNTIRDNKIFSVATQDHHDFALAWLQDWNGTLTDSTSNNRGSSNAYYHWNPEASWRVFAWGDQGEYAYDDLNSFNSTDGENNGRHMSSDEKNSILNAAGVPTQPDR